MNLLNITLLIAILALVISVFNTFLLLNSQSVLEQINDLTYKENLRGRDQTSKGAPNVL